MKKLKAFLNRNEERIIDILLFIAIGFLIAIIILALSGLESAIKDYFNNINLLK